MEHKIWLASLFASSVALSGCGAFDTEKKGSKAGENEPELTGSWKSGCMTADFLKLTHETTTLTYSVLGDFDRVVMLHADDQCASPSVEFKVVGTYDAVGEAQSVEGGAENINYTVHEARLAAKSDDAAKLLSAAKYCGVTDWKVDEEVDIAGKDCLGESLDKGEVVFDIFRLQDDGKTLLVGDTLLWFDATDADDRPTQLATDYPYTKQ